jgi:hypothetical protein
VDCKWDGINLAEFVKCNPDDFVALALNTRLNSRVRQRYAVAQLVEACYECLRHQYSLSIHSVNTRHQIFRYRNYLNGRKIETLVFGRNSYINNKVK